MLQLLKLPDGTVKVLVEGEKRVKILKYNNEDETFLKCEVQAEDDQNASKELDTFAQGLMKKYEKLLILSKKDLNEGVNSLRNLRNAAQIANNISSNLNIQIFEKQELLEILDLKKRLEKFIRILKKKLAFFLLRKKLEGELKIKWKKLKENTI